MALTPEEAAQLALLQAKALAPDESDDDQTAGEVAAEVSAATAGAVGEAVAATAEAVADAVADAQPEPDVVIVHEPTGPPITEVIAAEADAEVAVIEAQTEATIRLMEAERAADDDEPVGNLYDETIGPIVDSLAPDEAPKPAHPWFRPLGRKS